MSDACSQRRVEGASFYSSLFDSKHVKCAQLFYSCIVCSIFAIGTHSWVAKHSFVLRSLCQTAYHLQNRVPPTYVFLSCTKYEINFANLKLVCKAVVGCTFTDVRHWASTDQCDVSRLHHTGQFPAIKPCAPRLLSSVCKDLHSQPACFRLPY
jgi:hypothetical protein